MMLRKNTVLWLLAAGVLMMLAWLARGPAAESATATVAAAPGHADLPAPPAAPAVDVTRTRVEPVADAEEAFAPRGSDVSEADMSLVLLTGRTVDERRLPVAGARITLQLDDGQTMVQQTRAGGRFAFSIPRPAATSSCGSILAVDERRRVAARHVEILSAEAADAQGVPVATRQDLGTLVLLAGGELLVRVSDEGVAVGGAVVLLETGRARARTLSDQTDASGLIRMIAPIGPATVTVRTTDGRAGRAQTSVAMDAPTELVIDLRPTRTIDVLVVDEQGEAIPDATVAAFEQAYDFLQVQDDQFLAYAPAVRAHPRHIEPTDESGQARVTDVLADQALMVTARAPGHYAERGDTTSATVAAGSERVTLTLKQQPGDRTIRWPVVQGEVEAPAEGAIVTLRPVRYRESWEPCALPDIGVMRDGMLIVEGCATGSVGGLAVADDGSLARLSCDSQSATGKETSFRKPRSISVIVRRDSREPVAGARAIARDQGNGDLTPWVATNATGMAMLRDLVGGRADVFVVQPGESGRGALAGTVDLDAGDGRVDLVVRDGPSVVAEILLDGERRLPTEYRLRSDVGDIAPVAEDAERAELRFHLPATAVGSERVPISLRARGCQPWIGYVERTAPAPATLRIELATAGAIECHVTAKDLHRIELVLQVMTPDAQSWTDARYGLGHRPGTDGIVRFDQLASGRYRLRERHSAFVGPLIDVIAGAEARTTIDLTSGLEIAGRLVLPEGYGLEGARILIDGERPLVDGFAPQSPGARLDGNGSFRFAVAEPRSVQLRAWHPLLEQGPVIEVLAPSKDVRLELGEGSVTRFTANLDDQNRQRSLRVRLLRGGANGELISEHLAMMRNNAFQFGGFQPGTYGVWIDPGATFAPKLLNDVTLAAGATDLGAIVLEPGCAIHVRQQAREGASHPRLFVVAKPIAEPRYLRQMNSNGEQECVLSGLGTGRFEVTVATIMSDQRVTRLVDLDGEHDVTIDVDWQ